MRVLACSNLQVVRRVRHKLNAVCQLYASLFSITDGVRRNFENIKIHLLIFQCVLLFLLNLLPLVTFNSYYIFLLIFFLKH